MTLIRKLFSSRFDPGVATGLALPMLLWLGTALYGLKLKPAAVADGTAFRLYYLALLLCSLVWAVNALRCRMYGNGLALFGLLLVMLQGVWWHGSHFSAKVALGEGEPSSGFHEMEKGWFVRSVRLPIALVKGADKEKGEMVFSIDRREEKVRPGSSFSWNEFRLKPTNLRMAPLFIVDSAKGGNVDAAYVKLGISPHGSDYFQVGILPHRFYVSDSRHAPSAGKEESGAATPSHKMHLRIVRDKLIIFDKDVAMGEAVYFDGHYITYQGGAPWVDVAVEKQQSHYFLVSGAVFLLAGWAVGLLRRRQ